VVAAEMLIRRVTATPSSSTSASADSEVDTESFQFQRDLLELKRLSASLGCSMNDWRDVRLSFRSATINFDKGWRQDTKPPLRQRGRVLVFGGSSVLCLETRDSDTVVSSLQELLLDHGVLHQCLNRGVSGATVKRNWSDIRQEAIRETDVVVVLFGLNDAKVTQYAQIGRGVLAHVPLYVQALGYFRIRLRSLIAHYLWTVSVKLDVTRQEDLCRSCAIDVTSILDQIDKHVVRRGARFVAVLEPHLWMKQSEWSESEKRASGRYATTTPLLLEYQYEAFRQQLLSRGWFYSAEHACNTPRSAFIDWSHRTALGNKILATRLHSILESSQSIGQ
jgi:hypothetical protein